MAVAASVLVQLRADIAQFVNPIKQATASLKNMEQKAKSMGESLSVIKWTSLVYLASRAMSAARSVDALAFSITSSLNDIGRQAEIVGVNTEKWQEFSYAAKMSDISTEQLQVGFKKLANIMTDAAANQAIAVKFFKDIGVSATDTSNGIRPLSGVIMDLMDKFKTWEDGAAKAAIATTLFGRSGIELIPFMNRGSEGFKALAEEAKKYGIIIGSDIVRAGSEAEDKFKILNAQLEAQKTKLMPLVNLWIEIKTGIYGAIGAVGDAITWLEKLGKKLDEINYKKFGTTFYGGRRYEERVGTSEERMKRSLSATTEKPKGKAPITGEKSEISKTGIFDLQKEILRGQEDFNKEIEEAWDAVYQYYKELDAEELKRKEYVQMQTLTGEEQLAQDVTDAWAAVYKVFEDFELEREKNHEEALKRIKESEEEFTDTVKEAWDYYYKYVLEEQEKQDKLIEERNKPIIDFIDGIGDAWTNVFSNMIDGTESFKEVIIKSFKSLADSIIQQFMRIMVEWLKIQAMTGIAKLVGGIATSAIGGVGGGTSYAWSGRAAEGGIVTSPRNLLVGESGPEAIVPLKDNKSFGNNTYVYISAVDTQSFNDAIRRNPGSVLNVIRKNERENISARQ